MKPAIFDLDGTILRGNSWTAFYWRTWMRRPRCAAGLAWATALRAAGRLDGRGLREAALASLRGLSAEMVTAEGERLWTKTLSSWVRPAARREIAARRAAGYATGLATGAFDFVAEAAARELKLEVWACTRLEYRDGVCTGRIAGAEARGTEKASAVKAALAGREVDWAEACSFSDDAEDAPLWRLTGERVWVRRRGSGDVGIGEPGVRGEDWDAS